MLVYICHAGLLVLTVSITLAAHHVGEISTAAMVPLLSLQSTIANFYLIKKAVCTNSATLKVVERVCTPLSAISMMVLSGSGFLVLVGTETGAGGLDVFVAIIMGAFGFVFWIALHDSVTGKDYL